MFKLLKKEFLLCLHPTCFLFLAFCLFVFIPNYPYEVAFFFSGLSAFFVFITARENGDVLFSSTLPVRKGDVVRARILFHALFQTALLLLTGVMTAIKENVFPAEAQINMAGSSANLAFLGYGAVLLGIFDLIFFPLVYRKPANVGVPFVLAAAVQFVCIALLIVLRFAAPPFRDVLNTPDPQFIGAKLAVFFTGIAFYAGAVALAMFLSVRNFEKTDLS